MGVIGLDEAIAELRGMQARATDASEFMADVAEGAAGTMRQNLVDQKSQGGRMRALSPAYAKRKTKRYPGKTILRATDQGLSSITSNSGPTFAEAGPTDEKMAYHASPEPRSVMPLRDPFYVPAADEDKAAGAFADYVGPKR